MKTNDKRNKDIKNAKEALEYKQHATTRDLCLQNAEDFITAAKQLTNSSLQHIQFHLTALALEEIGKAELIEMAFVAGLNSQDTTYEETSIENHVKKFYMAFLGPAFGEKLSPSKKLSSYRD